MIKTTYLLALIATVFGSSLPRNVQTGSRIINGDDATAGEYPWQVSLQEPYGSGYWHFCGGSIISSNYIMSAAHCYKDPSMVTVYVGSVQKFSGGERYGITEFLAHPQYNPNDISMDYAVIKLERSLVFTSSVQAVVIPGPEYDATSQFNGPAVISGWGYSAYYGQNRPQNEMPTTLQYADVPVWTDAECSSIWGSYYQSSNMLCAGGSAGSCMGDSGGPIVQTINGTPTLLGATSWGSSKCDLDYPSVWAKLSAVRPWIVENTDLE